VTRHLASTWAAGRGPIGVLPVLLFRDRQWLTAVLAGWALALGGSVVLGVVLSWAAGGAAGPEFGAGQVPAAVLLVGIALVSPILETLIMAGALDVLRRLMPAWAAVVASSAGWGVAHSLLAPLWGVVIWWPFLIFSTLFVTWRSRGFWAAAGTAALVHILQNVGPAVLLVMGR
jgi:hypothetical protein